MLSCYENRTLNLRYIMNWPVTNKTYSTCSEDGKVNEANRKSFFRNKLQSLRPVAPIKSPPTCMTTGVVDAMRVVWIITIKDTNPPLFLTWARKAFAYTEHFPGSSIDILFHNYNWEDDTFLNSSKGRLTSQTEKNICSLNQVLPNPSEWLEFLSNNKNKFQLCNLLADFYTSEHIVTDKKTLCNKGETMLHKTSKSVTWRMNIRKPTKE